MVVSPDAGGVYRAKKFREGLAYRYGLDAGLAMIIKQRAKANEVGKHECRQRRRSVDVSRSRAAGRLTRRCFVGSRLSSGSCIYVV